MNSDHLGRFMRLNARKNLWILSNRSRICESAVRGYSQRSTSLINNIADSKATAREENRAPIRSLALDQNRRTLRGYPRHQQCDQAICATPNLLLSSVIQANRQRSMSISAAGLRMYDNKPKTLDDSHREELNKTPIDFRALAGRSISLPPYKTYQKRFIAMTNEAKTGSVKHGYMADELMVVDEALKRRLVVRFDRQPGVEDSPARLRRDWRNAGLTNRQICKSYQLRHDQRYVQDHFQPLGDRIREFDVKQYADGPAAYQGSKRTHNAGRDNDLPKQQPCLSLHNVLYKNHRLRSLGQRVRSQSLESKPENFKHNRTSPLGQLMKLSQAAKARPQQQQQQQQQQQPQQLKRQKQPQQQQLQQKKPQHKQQAQQQKPINKQQQQQQIKQQQQVSKIVETLAATQQHHAKQPLAPKRNVLPGKAEPMAPKARSTHTMATRVTTTMAPSGTDRKTKIAKERPSSTKKPLIESKTARAAPKLRLGTFSGKDNVKAITANKLSRTSHLTFMRSTTYRPVPARPRETKRVKDVKQNVKLGPTKPKQPATIRNANHLLAANATQVSASKRAFETRQQIIQAGMLHQHAQKSPEKLFAQQRQYNQKNHHHQQGSVEDRTMGKRPISKSSTCVLLRKSEVQRSRLSKGNLKQLSAQSAHLNTKRPTQILVEDTNPPTPSLPRSPFSLAAAAAAAAAATTQHHRSHNLNSTATKMPTGGTSIKAPYKPTQCPASYSGAIPVPDKATSSNYQKRQEQQRLLNPPESQWRRKN